MIYDRAEKLGINPGLFNTIVGLEFAVELKEAEIKKIKDKEREKDLHLFNDNRICSKCGILQDTIMSSSKSHKVSCQQLIWAKEKLGVSVDVIFKSVVDRL